ncbi:MAG TPA: electron transport complex subunit RsxC [Arenimonas sp.]|uniref:electron transport complex subunit RsxC n=1 Tax=Arenimonas sp. TaxID=1872635 RepID=UPI002D801D3D|nr:electron transport complex subunit RsxC [Arenimonas sp.]HEU0153332.1 electron transport complex subunit RsxC [Arenimonas sp.]
MLLHSFPGGLRLAGHKAVSTAGGLQPVTMPARLRLALQQHAGPPALPCVAPGDRVARGQRIASADGELSADLHAPCAGRVEAIEPGDPAAPPGRQGAHIVLVPQGGAEAPRWPALDPDTASPEALRERIRAAGVVGLGGAGFPTAEKLSVGRELLVLNGAECEPWIACDDALLREHADEVVLGGRVMARVVGAARVLLAIEDSMPEALAAARAACQAQGDGRIDVVAVPTIYPQGGERQLIRTLTGREVPRAGLPRDIGVIVQNVATARAAWRAVAHGEPLLERIVTVTGPGVARPGNFIVPLGTPVAHLVAQAGGYTDAARRLLLGGPMMGLALPHDQFTLGKPDNCVLVLGDADLRPVGDEMPCIRCGDCASACPARLLPQQLLWQVRADRLDEARDQGLFDCIECGCCDLACPSHIPLTAHFRHGKSALRLRAAEAGRAEAARERYESRLQRLQREADEREQRLAERRAGAAQPEAVAAALARARARRTGDGDAGPATEDDGGTTP